MSFTGASLVAQLVKNQFVMQESACNVGDVGSIPGLTGSLGEGKWPPAPVFLPGKSYGQRRLAGCSTWGHNSRTRLSNSTSTCELPYKIL